jgi:hypothetical protein
MSFENLLALLLGSNSYHDIISGLYPQKSAHPEQPMALGILHLPACQQHIDTMSSDEAASS